MLKLPQNKAFLLKIIGLYLIIITIFLLPFLQRKFISQKVESISKTPTQQLITGHPSRIVIPIANIDLKIINGDYNKNSNTWTLSNDSAVFATVTSQPNNVSGNTLIYGHDTNTVFYRTYQLQSDDLAFVYTDNGYTFIYKLVSSEIVKPTNTKIFDYQGAPMLTLQTCTGVFYQDRKLIYFNLEKII